MQEIKLLDNINTKFNETENRLFLDETPSGKRRNVEHLDLIEPWMEDTGNPFLNLRSKQLKIKRESPRLKRQSSLILPQNWRSIEKVVQTR